MLDKAKRLETDEWWWQHQSDGLAVFIGRDRFDRYRATLEFESLVVIGPPYFVKPLVPLLEREKRFYILAVSQNGVRLFESTYEHVTQLEPQGLPADLQSALNIDEYVTTLQQHTVGRAAAGAGGPLLHGQSDMDIQKKDQILQFFRRIDRALQDYLHNSLAPLVFAGVEYLFPIFQQASSYKQLVPTPLAGNPDLSSPQQLYDRAWSVVATVFRQAHTSAVERFEKLASSGRATADLREICTAAKQGQVETLLIAEGEHLWGTVDKQSGMVARTDPSSDGAQELLNDMVVHVLANSGTVYAMPRQQVPGNQPAAAILRYPTVSLA